MKSGIPLSILVLLSLTLLSACTSDSGTSVSVAPITTSNPVNITNSSPSNIVSSQPVQQRRRGGHHESVTPEVKSVSTGTSTTNADGTITIQKEVSYVTPAGIISTDFTLTTDSSGVVTAVQAGYSGNDHEDLMYHHRFNSSSASQIIGKSIKTLSVNAVGGASLTTDAFNAMITSL